MIKRGAEKKVTNLFSAFGGIKETNVSAGLAFLFHKNPELPGRLFGIQETIIEVKLEESHEGGEDRYDILLRTSKKDHVIEIKLNAHARSQVARYHRKKDKVYLIGRKLWTGQYNNFKNVKLTDWEELADHLRKSVISKKTDQYYKGLVICFLKHLEENLVIKSNFEDVYTRDMSGTSVNMYFNQNIYKCQPKFFASAKNARYFAPYFSKANIKGSQKSVIPVGTGISFISEITESLVAAEKEIWDLLRERKYSLKDTQLIFNSFKWRRKGRKEHAIFLLGNPMRFVQRPITKFDFWGIPGGAMPAMCLDFGDLVAAANGLMPLKK